MFGAPPFATSYFAQGLLLSAALTLAPEPVATTWTVPGSALAATGEVPLAGARPVAAWTVPAPTLDAGTVFTPGVVSASWGVPVPSLDTGGFAPGPALATWGLPASTLTLGSALVFANPAVVLQWVVTPRLSTTTDSAVTLTHTPAVAAWVTPGGTLAPGGASIALVRVAVPQAAWVVPAPTLLVNGVLVRVDVPHATWAVPVSFFGFQGHDPNCECCMATKLKVANQALLKIGVSQTLVSFTDQTREAYTIAELFDESLREAQRSYPWAFATQYSTPTVYFGSPTAPANQDWVYAYRYPGDGLFIRRLVRAGVGREFDPTPPRFRVGRTYGNDSVSADDDVLLIFANEPNLQVEYTKEVKCSLYYGDAVFEDALSWLVASKIAPSLSRDNKMAEKCFAMYVRAFAFASALSAQEQQQPAEGEAEWIRDRNA